MLRRLGGCGFDSLQTIQETEHFHCHISWHGEPGLVVQFISRSDGLREIMLPPSHRDLYAMPLQELEKGFGPKEEGYHVETHGGSSRSSFSYEGESVNDCSYE